MCLNKNNVRRKSSYIPSYYVMMDERIFLKNNNIFFHKRRVRTLFYVNVVEESIKRRHRSCQKSQKFSHIFLYKILFSLLKQINKTAIM